MGAARRRDAARPARATGPEPHGRAGLDHPDQAGAAKERSGDAADPQRDRQAGRGEQHGPQPGRGEQHEEERLERDIGELLADVERERDEYLELARRTKADFENYRKRVAGEAAQAEKRGRAALARELLPVLDNLERALAVAEAEAGSGDQGSLVEGVSLVLGELNAVLERSGIESYEPAGERFDPDWHEAMMTRPAPADRDGTVLEVLEKGYRLDGQVLRAARVVVGSAADAASAGAGSPDEPGSS